MRAMKFTRVLFALIAVCALLAMMSPASVAVRARNETTAPSNVRLTPPAPVFDDKERVAELVQRRERVAKAIGPQSFMILFSTEPRVYTNDVDYPYRQENNLYYLTQLKQKGATLVLLPGNTKQEPQQAQLCQHEIEPRKPRKGASKFSPMAGAIPLASKP